MPKVRLYEGVCATSKVDEYVSDAALVVVGVPLTLVSSTLTPILPALKGIAILLRLTKGFAPRMRPLPPLLTCPAPGHSCVQLTGAAIADVDGGKRSMLYGPAGLSDLVATRFARDSHNCEFGQSLAWGTAIEIETEMRKLPEGARAATAGCALASAGQARAPLARLVCYWTEGELPSLDSAIRELQTTRRTK